MTQAAERRRHLPAANLETLATRLNSLVFNRNEAWIFLDFLGFSRPKRAISMGYARLSREKIFSPLSSLMGPLRPFAAASRASRVRAFVFDACLTSRSFWKTACYRRIVKLGRICRRAKTRRCQSWRTKSDRKSRFRKARNLPNNGSRRARARSASETARSEAESWEVK